MKMKTNPVDKWQQQFIQSTAELVNSLLDDVKQCDTYGDATSLVKKLSSQGYGTATDTVGLAIMKVNSAVCEAVLHLLYQEERTLPIKRGESNDSK